MGLFDDLSRFLEMRLEEFLKQHPQLELQALEEKLRDQEDETLRLMTNLRQQQQQQEADILETAQEIQRWHIRTEKAQAAGRQDLAQAAQEREAALLRQGNQRWGQMEMLKARLEQTETLLQKIQIRRQEVQAQAAQAQAEGATRAAQEPAPTWDTKGWYQSGFAPEPDPLEEQFQQWEMDEELDQLKRNMGR